MATRQEYELLFALKASLGNNFAATFKSAQNAMKSLGDTMKTVQNTQKDISAYEKQTSALEKNKAKLEALNKEQEQLRAKMKETGAPVEDLRAKIERNRTEVDRTTVSIRQQEVALGTLGEKLRSSGVNTQNLAAENERLSKSYSALKNNQNEVGKLNKLYQDNQKAISKTKGELAGTVAVTAGVAAAIYASTVSIAASFEEQMSSVAAISGANAEEMKVLTKAAEKAGTTTRFTARQSGKALEYMAMAGWKTNAMVAALPGVLNLAAASGEELGLVSDIVTDAMTAFQMEAGQAGHFSDVLAAASSNANTNVAKLGESFKYVAPVAGAMKFNCEDVSITLGLMANASIKESQAGTALRTSLVNLAKPTKQMQAAMDRYGISLTNSDSSMKSLLQIIKEMRTNMRGLGEAEQSAAAATIFGKEGMAGMLAVINSSEADFDKLTKAIYGSAGAAEKMAKIKMDNYAGSIIEFKSALEGLQISIGRALLPALTELFKSITPVVQQMAEFAGENPELTKSIFKMLAAFAGLKIAFLAAKLAFLEVRGAALFMQRGLAICKGGILQNDIAMHKAAGKSKLFGKALSGIGAIGGKIGSVFSKAFAPVIAVGSKLLSPFLKVFGVLSTLLGPIAPIAAIIIGIVVAVQLLINNLEAVRGVVEKVFGKAGVQAFDAIVNSVKGVADAVKGMFSSDGIAVMGQKINNVFGPKGVAVFNGFITILQAVGSGLIDLWNAINTYITPIFQNLFGWIINDILPAVSAKFAEWAPGIATIIGAIGTAITTIISVVGAAIQVALPFWQGIFGAVFSAVSGIITVFIELFSGVINTFKALINGDVFGALTALYNMFANIFGAIKKVVSGVFDSIKNGIAGVVDKIKGLAGTKVSGGGGGVTVKVPGYAGGTGKTPDTFVAGEKGAELITNAPNRTVFTAQETRELFRNKKDDPVPKFGGGLGGGDVFSIKSSPTIIVNGNVPDDLEAKLAEHDRRLLEEIRRLQQEEKERKRRLAYDEDGTE